MSSDISRPANVRRQSDTGIVAQQGRVIVDRDVNALQEIVNDRDEAEMRDVIGPCGTPDDGFAISVADGSPPFHVAEILFRFPERQAVDFSISPGTMYVGGQRVVFPPHPGGQPATYSYFDQPDWPSPPMPTFAGKVRDEVIYLSVHEHELSAVEDPDLLDVALGGVDTTQRLRLVRRVERAPVNTADCAKAWTELTGRWLAAGWSFDPGTMRLEPQSRLQVSFVQSGAPSDPCDPVATGGYLGAENQLIRVRIADAGGSGSPAGPASLLWGYDNASFLYRVVDIAANGTMLQLASDPPDAFHTPQANQAVEILRTASIIASEPDETDPTGRTQIVRCVAAETGFVTTLTQPYGPPSTGGTTKYLVLAQALPAAYAGDGNPLFVRVWQGHQPFVPGTAAALVDPVTNATNGVQVTISVPSGEVPAAGAYWLIAVRPSTPQAVYPEDLLIAPRPPDGPREWVCPLATIAWGNPVGKKVHDCRQSFANLVALTRRPAGCCTVNVAPADLTATNTLQTVVDRAATLAQHVTVCLGAGTFVLAGSLRLNSAHDNLTLSSCAGGGTIAAASGSDPSSFSDGLIVVTNASGVSLRGLRLVPASASLPDALRTEIARLAASAGSAAARVSAASFVSMIGVRAVSAEHLTVEDCVIEFPQPAGAAGSDVFGAAIFLEGDCSGLTVAGCSVTSVVAPTYTPPAPAAVSSAPAPGLAVRELVTAAPPPASPPASPLSSPPSAPILPVLLSLGIGDRVRSIALNDPIGVIAKPDPPAPFVVTVGLLACGNTSADLRANDFSADRICRLGDVAILGNRFSKLTITALGLDVDERTMRFQDNSSIGCVAGLLWQLNGAGPPTGESNLTLFDALMGAVTGFTEARIAMLLGEIYPLPAGVTGKVDTSVTPASLFVIDNQIETILANGGNAALMLSLNRTAATGADTSASLILAGNRLRNQTIRSLLFRGQVELASTALLVVADKERCAVTGNLIFNEKLPSAFEVSGGSLTIIPNSNAFVRDAPAGSSRVSMLAVTGNVLEGATNLARLLRSAAPTDTWVAYNSLD
jgi:hypothetical protein